MEEQQNFSRMPSQSTISPVPVSETKLIGVGDLLKKSWRIYKSRFWTFFGIVAIPLIIVFLIFVFLGFLGLASLLALQELGFIPLLFLIVTFILIAFFAGTWPQIALLYAIKEKEQAISIVEAFKKSWRKIIPYLWISSLTGIAIFLGFILLIIPSFIFAIWFSLSSYVFIDEDKRGFKALSRSKQLVRGNWWQVAWRFLGLSMILMIVLLPATFILEALNISFVSQIISLIAGPFFTIYGFLVYKDLKRIKGEGGKVNSQLG
ncbi:MAG: hypothetical protein ISS87_00035 [Candidatus Pacebacteria bacterium]|nr:hypothetical protein [Candidatus Paceibacterota bacterium]